MPKQNVNFFFLDMPRMLDDEHVYMEENIYISNPCSYLTAIYILPTFERYCLSCIPGIDNMSHFGYQVVSVHFGIWSLCGMAQISVPLFHSKRLPGSHTKITKESCRGNEGITRRSSGVARKPRGRSRVSFKLQGTYFISQPAPYQVKHFTWR